MWNLTNIATQNFGCMKRQISKKQHRFAKTKQMA
jgi:hypothetical protein